MKLKIVNVVVAALLFALIISGCTTSLDIDKNIENNSSIISTSISSSTSDDFGQGDAEGFVLCGENEGTRLFFNPQTTRFYAENKINGFKWYSNPVKSDEDSFAAGIFRMEMSSLFIVKYVDKFTSEVSKFNTYTGSVMDSNFIAKKIDNGVVINFSFKEYKVTIPIKIYLDKENLVAQILTSEIKKDNPDLFIYSIGLLPYFGAGQEDETGYVFVPDGSGGIINFNNGKYSCESYSRPIYGLEPTEKLAVNFQNTENESIKMPVFGIKRGNNAFLAIVSESEELGSINAYTNKQITSYANSYAEFTLKCQMIYKMGTAGATIYERDGNTTPVIGVRYSFLTDNDANYSGMARKYKKYLVDTQEFKEGKTMDAACFISLYGGLVKTVSNLGVMMDKVIPLTTTKEAKLIVDEMKAEGIDSIVVSYNNWNDDELFDKMTASSDISSNINDKSYNLEDLQNNDEIRFYPSIKNTVSFRKGQNPLSVYLHTVCDISGVPIRFKDYSVSLGEETGKPYYYLTYTKIDKHLNDLFMNFSKNNFKSIGISDMGNVLYNDYRFGIVKRPTTRKILEKSMQLVNELFQNVLFDNPNIYSVKYSDDIINIPISSSGQDLIDEDIPFLNIVVSGISRYSSSPINNSNLGDKAFLKVIETGSMINYSWIYRDTTILKNTRMSYLYSADYRYWLKTAAQQYKITKQIHEMTQSSPLFSHEKVSDDVYLTTYENSTKVYVNYGTADYVLLSGEIVKAGNYLVIKGGIYLG